MPSRHASAGSSGFKSAPMTIGGLPLASWVFACRIWIAMVLAIYASFWLQLQSPYEAALTVVILAIPTLGQSIAKAGSRFGATVAGAIAAVAITGLFAQSDVLILVAFAVWIGLCVTSAGFVDGNRNYAAVTCATTVSIVAIEHIDDPQGVFEAALSRGSSITVGILAISLVYAISFAPSYYLQVLARLMALRGRVLAYARENAGSPAERTLAAAHLLQDITALRKDVRDLAAEAGLGPARSLAARNAMVGLVVQLSAVRCAEAQARQLTHLVALPAAFDRADVDILADLALLRDGKRPERVWRAPAYVCRRIAVETGVRASLSFAIAAFIFLYAGWPATNACLALIAVLIGLAIASPFPRTIARLSLICAPVACVLAGIFKFSLLGSTNAFPILALSLAPLVIGASLLIILPSPAWSSLGRFTLVFVVAILMPSNPQTYGPQSYLMFCLFICLSAVFLYALQFVVPPLSDASKLRLLSTASLGGTPEVERRSGPILLPQEALFRDATVIGQMMSSSAGLPSNNSYLETAMRNFDDAAAARLRSWEAAACLENL